MLDVYFTIDVEVWCTGWKDIDSRFASSFEYYIHGVSRRYGLPYQLKVLGDHGLRSVCFVESLFAERFGNDPLAEIVGLVQTAGHEVQLHVHPEWVDEAQAPIFPGMAGKRSSLAEFTFPQQVRLLEIGLSRLKAAGAVVPNAFRAGNFACNRETLDALAASGIGIDASYDASQPGHADALSDGRVLLEPTMIGGTLEVPMTVYSDGTRRLRHAQLTACSYRELEGLLWSAVEKDLSTFVILSHGNELTREHARRLDPVVLGRFRKLCALLERNRDVFNVRGFHGPAPTRIGTSYRMLSSPYWKTVLRMAEQMGGRLLVSGARG